MTDTTQTTNKLGNTANSALANAQQCCSPATAGPCPRCGYCPHCGRGGQWTYPYYPNYPYPYYGQPYIYCGGASGAGGVTSQATGGSIG
jgi:hypothetical protein